jgi:hypothetical protein
MTRVRPVRGRNVFARLNFYSSGELREVWRLPKFHPECRRIGTSFCHFVSLSFQCLRIDLLLRLNAVSQKRDCSGLWRASGIDGDGAVP